MDARQFAQDTDPGDGVTGQLSQRLAAEARAASAEKDDVRRASRNQPMCHVAQRRNVVVPAGVAQHRKRLVLVASANPIECRFGFGECGIKRGFVGAVRADAIGARKVDGLDQRHAAGP